MSKNKPLPLSLAALSFVASAPQGGEFSNKNLSSSSNSVLSDLPDLVDEAEEEEFLHLAKEGNNLLIIPEGGFPEIEFFETMSAMRRRIASLEGFEGAVIPVVGTVLPLTEQIDGRRAIIFPEGAYLWADDLDDDKPLSDDFSVQEGWYTGKYRYMELNLRKAMHEEFADDVIPAGISENTEVHENVVQEQEDPEALY